MDGFCQLKFKRRASTLCLFLLLYACSSTKVAEQKDFSIEAKPSWFAGNPVYGFKGHEGELLAHAFFDLSPLIDRIDREVHFVLMTPERSPYGYGLELTSGRKYRRVNYCERDDVWKTYSKDLNGPPYVEGVLPRLLDAQGTPQRIIVFGESEYLEPLSLEPQMPPFSQRARVVGGLTQEFCMQDPCQDGWYSRVILVAVNPKDPKLAKVQNLTDLQAAVGWRWELTPHFLANDQGHHLSVQGSVHPAYKVRKAQFGAVEAIDQAVKQGHLFGDDEVETLARSCRKLYDYVWTNVDQLRKYHDGEIAFWNEWKNKANISKKSWLAKQNEINQHRAKHEGQFKGQFSKFFAQFYAKYHQRYLTCSHYVRPASIEHEPKRFWFFAQLDMFFKMQELGYVYRCGNTHWTKNMPKSDKPGEFYYSQVLELERCDSRQLDQAFKMAPVMMSNLLSTKKPHFYFLEYDTGIGAAHEKIYAWIYDDGLGFKCNKSSDRKQITAREHSRILPADIFWDEFASPFDQNFIR